MIRFERGKIIARSLFVPETITILVEEFLEEKNTERLETPFYSGERRRWDKLKSYGQIPVGLMN